MGEGWRSTLWNQTKVAQAIRGTLVLDDGRHSTKLKWASGLWDIPHMMIDYIKVDAMHALFTDGVFNKTMACLMYKMCVDRVDLPGRKVDDRCIAFQFMYEHFDFVSFVIDKHLSFSVIVNDENVFFLRMLIEKHLCFVIDRD